MELRDQDVPEATRQEFEKLKEDYPEVFSLNNQDIGHTQLVTMHVDTGDSPPICQKPYTLPLKHYSWVQQEIKTLERAGIIKKSLSPWASPIVVVPKKSGPGEPPRWRMCVDFRKINDLQPQVRRVDSTTSGNISLVPLPKINEMYAVLHGAKIFTTLDLRSGYYHINLDEESKAKTAFITPFGKYEFNSIPFGLAQAPAYFQQLISMVLQDCRDFVMAYLDDIIIFSQTPEEHLKHIEIIFQKLKVAGLKLKESKCDFFKSEIHYLGHLISDKGIQPLPEKLDTIQNMPHPQTPKEIKQFLGLTGYYRKFILHFSEISRPVAKLTAKDTAFEWTPQCQLSFEMLKDALMSAPILKYPDTEKHLISDKGIQPLPEKLDTIQNMPHPRTTKEIKQFLGLTGYYRKFVPHFSEISRPVVKLTAKDTAFEWTPQCQLSFEMLKDALMSAPILKYPDTEKPYTIFTDASKYGWAGVLTQEHTSIVNSEKVTTNHPVAYVSGMFRGSQLNWAAMMKEAYAIYMTVKKLTFYLTGADITLRSDHLPLNKFLQKNTLNLHVNNWAVEIKSFKIKFVHIAGKENVITDNLSHLIDIDPDIVLEPELKDYEFGSYYFKTLPKARRSSVAEKLASVDGVDVCEISITYDNDENLPNSVKMPLSDEKFSLLQVRDEKIKNLRVRVNNGEYSDFYKIENNVLYHMVVENNHKFDASVLPAELINTALFLGHNQSGHNGFQRTYAAIMYVCLYVN